MNPIYKNLLQAKIEGRKLVAILVDPDKVTEDSLLQLTSECIRSKVDYIFVGGSLITNGDLRTTIRTIKNNCSIPIIIFPGSHHQIEDDADGILLLSLISGRNPDLLIGQHVIASPRLKQSKLEILPTGYILIDSGNTTTVQYVSNTVPIPAEKTDIAGCTALAGEQLGLKVIFAEAGSGALNPVSVEMIQAINSMISIPLIVGGGIRTPEKAIANCKAGADLIVIGNSVEKDPSLIFSISEAIHNLSK